MSDPEQVVYVVNTDQPSYVVAEKPQKSDGCLQSRYVFTLFGFLGLAFAYMMRVNLSVGIVAMVKPTPTNENSTDVCPDTEQTDNSTVAEGDFDWTAHQQGIILSSFFWGYILTQIPGGLLAQKYGGKWLFGGGIVLPAILTLITPVAAEAGPWVMTATRVIMGFFEGVTFPALTHMMGRWVPPQERSRLGAFAYAGTQFGTVIGMPLSGVLADDVGWPSVFYVFGVVALAWFAFWAFLIYETPDTHPRISPVEKQFIAVSIGREKKEKTAPTPWKALFSNIHFWAIIIVHFGHNWGFYTLLTELPTYMKNILHFDMKANGLISALPYLSMWLSSMVFSYIADKLIASKKLNITNVRKIFNTIAQYGPAVCLIAASYTGCDRVGTVVLLTVAMGLSGACYSGFFVNHMDQSKRFAGAMMGITNTAGTLSGIISPYVVGVLTDGQQTIERWRVVFFIAAAIYFFANTFYLFYGSSEEQPFNNIGVSANNEISTVYGSCEENKAYEEDPQELKKI